MLETDTLVLPNDPWEDHVISSDDLGEEKDCPICYCDFKKGDSVAKLNCGHIFHKNCIILWFDKKISSPTCPICRTNMFENESNQKQPADNANQTNIEFNYDQNISPNTRTNSNNQPNTNHHTRNSNKNQTSTCCCILI